MTDVRDVRSLMEAAEQAAGAGHYVSAREYLREAIARQEASVGPTHPDLANALNNLGVVYEREGKLVEAEECYRRAYAIASAALEPSHPSVVMSARNLQEFCEANGLAFDAAPGSPTALTPPAGPAPEPRPSLPAADTAGSAPLPRITSVGSAAPAASSTSSAAHGPPMGRLVVAGLIVGALIAIGVIVIQSRSAGHDPHAGAATVPAKGNRPVPVPKARKVPPRGEGTPEARPRVAPPPPEQTARSAASAPTLAAAELCRTLQTASGWRCVRATGTLQPGVVFFYTRLLSQTDTTIEHRWYRGNRLHQTVTLRVHANARAGYRTYSQMTVSPARAGDWRVELRTADGTVLHEERFTVGQ